MANHKLITMTAPVTIHAADAETPKGPRTFSSLFYTGGVVEVENWDLPVVVDLAGLKAANVLVANLDHKQHQRVGNFDVVNDGQQLIANGKASAATPYRDEVVKSADEGYQWQTSLEVKPHKVEELAKGKKATVNGQEITGPAYITRTGTLKGFGFVSHGADDNTTATIAASAASSSKGKKMDLKCKEWIEAMGFDVDALEQEQAAALEANYKGQNGKSKKIVAADPFEARKIEAKRRSDIRQFADRAIMFAATLGRTIPSFVLATLFIYFLSYKLGWFPIYGADSLVHYILPAIALSLATIGRLTRLNRAAMLDVINQDYIRTAYAKGVAPAKVMLKHALKPASIPMVTVLGTRVAELLTGSFVIERIFAMPGIGRYLIQSIGNRDYPTIMGITIFYSIILLVSMLVVDIAYGWIDPRVRLQARESAR